MLKHLMFSACASWGVLVCVATPAGAQTSDRRPFITVSSYVMPPAPSSLNPLPNVHELQRAAQEQEETRLTIARLRQLELSRSVRKLQAEQTGAAAKGRPMGDPIGRSAAGSAAESPPAGGDAARPYAKTRSNYPAPRERHP